MEYLVKLRYFPGDPLIPITDKDLRSISEACDLNLKLEEVKGEDDGTGEKTLDKDLGSITQTLITLSGDRVSSVQQGLRDLFKMYRSPRTVYSLWGSTPAGEKIAWDIIEEMDGWW